MLYSQMRRQGGFTLVEILVVIVILGILSTAVLSSVQNGRAKGKIASAEGELRQIRNAVTSLELDTGLLPDGNAASPCVVMASDNEISLSESSSGLSEQGTFPGTWSGPYMKNVPRDPWDNPYIFDRDYTCNEGGVSSNGCEAYGTNQSVQVIHSRGPNESATNTYDGDNIVIVLCVESS